MRTPAARERREPTAASAGAAARGGGEGGGEVRHLRSCRAELQEALRVEGIDPAGPLGVWSRALGAALGGLAEVMEVQTSRVEDKAAAVERTMLAEVERVRAAVEEARALTSRLKVEAEGSRERRKQESLALAQELGLGIKDTLRTALLIRERRWNRRQNWGAALAGAAILAGCFAAGAAWSDRSRPRGGVQEVMDRCVARRVLDEVTRRYFCPVDVVLGQP